MSFGLDFRKIYEGLHIMMLIPILLPAVAPPTIHLKCSLVPTMN
jgi:hypothetical protein